MRDLLMLHGGENAAIGRILPAQTAILEIVHEETEETKMIMHPVNSSNIKAVGHDSVTNELHVHFTDGSKYKYHDFPANSYVGFMAAQSAGAHFHANIKGQFRHTKVA